MAKTKEEMREYHRNWSKNNWEARKASYYKWRDNPLNKEKVKEIDRRCYAKTKSRDKAARMLQGARYRAKVQGLPFDIVKSDIDIPEFCPVFPWVKLRSGDHDSRPELDRIIPELGYIKGNVRVVCSRANRIKSDASLKELQAIINYMLTTAS